MMKWVAMVCFPVRQACKIYSTNNHIMHNGSHPAGQKFQQTTVWNTYLIFSPKIGFDISCKLKCQSLFSREKK